MTLRNLKHQLFSCAYCILGINMYIYAMIHVCKKILQNLWKGLPCFCYYGNDFVLLFKYQIRDVKFYKVKIKKC